MSEQDGAKKPKAAVFSCNGCLLIADINILVGKIDSQIGFLNLERDL